MDKSKDTRAPKLASTTTQSIFPIEFETMLLSHVKENHLPKRERGHKNRPFSNRDLSTFLPTIKFLHESFTKNGGSQLGPYFRYHEARGAYLLAFFPLNLGKLISIIRESNLLKELTSGDTHSTQHGDGPPGDRHNPQQGDGPKGEISILDFGAGPMTSTLALLLAEPKLANRVKVTAVDREFEIMKDGRKLLQNFFPVVKNIYLEDRIPTNRSYDLVVASHALNEIRDFEKSAMRLLNVTKENGIVLFLEPATRVASNILMGVRETVLKKDGWSILYPCLHSDECPLLPNPKFGWCHQINPINLPTILRSIRSTARLDPAVAKTSSLVIKRSVVKPKLTGKRVLSNPMKTPNGPVVYVCQPKIPAEVQVKEGSGLRPGSLL